MDRENNCKYLTETEDFPYILGMDEEEEKQAVEEFLESIESDDSSWVNGGWQTDCTYNQIFDGVEILAEIEKEIY